MARKVLLSIQYLHDCAFLSLFNWIVTAGVKGVTPKQPHEAEKRTSKRAVSPDCGYRIFGARGVKTATWGKKGRYTNLVDLNKKNKNLFQNLHKHIIMRLNFRLIDFPTPCIHPDTRAMIYLFLQLLQCLVWLKVLICLI
jgi:hypothetical protein